MRNHSYENDFDLHENETACRTHFHMKGFALRLVLKQRHKSRKWPIVFVFAMHIINILLTELRRSVWENLYLGRVYRPRCVRSVLTTSVNILPSRPPARLIRVKHPIYSWTFGQSK